MSLRLDNMLRYGTPQPIRLDASGDHKGPSKGYAWLVLFGNIYHITGADTSLMVRSKKNPTDIVWRTCIPSAEGTGTYPLFCNQADAGVAQRGLIFLTDVQELDMTGGVGYYGKITVLEWAV